MATAVSIAQKFAGENLDLILGVATPTTQAVVKADHRPRRSSSRAVTDPVGAGLVTDPNAPAANVTGVSDMQPVKPILELVKQSARTPRPSACVYNAGESNSVFLVKARRRPPPSMGLNDRQGHGQHLGRGAGGGAVAGRPRRRHHGASATTPPSRRSRRSSRSAEQNKIPLVAGDPDSVKRGAAAAYGFDYTDLGKQAGDDGRPDPQRHADQGHPGRVRQEPAALGQREGRGGAGRHHPGRPGQPRPSTSTEPTGSQRRRSPHDTERPSGR